MNPASEDKKDSQVASSGEEEAPYSIKETRWQVVLLRAIKAGDLATFIEEASLHPEAIHEHFTKEMLPWELEWESYKWFELLDSTAMYIASTYTQPAIVSWLLENGAAPDEPCYNNLLPAEVIGQCRTGDNEGEQAIKELLAKPRICLKPPPAPQTHTKAGPEDVMIVEFETLPQEDPDTPPVQVQRRVRKRMVKAKIELDWRAHWLPNGTQFEVRVREAGAQDWKCHRVHAAHKTLELLPLSTTYEAQVRGQNVAGWSSWSPMVSITTPSASTR